MKKISFIVPMYNVEEYIEECLESLVKQSLDSFEIVIINDGSTDRSLDIANRYKQQYKDISIISTPNRGLSSARNLAIENANGEYIMFVDSDDFIDLECGEKLYNQAKKYNADIIRGRYSYKLEDINTTKGNIEGSVITGIEYIIHELREKCYEVVAVVNLIKLEFIKNNKLLFRKNVKYEDHEYTLRLFTTDPTCRVLSVDYPYYYYRLRENSITSTAELKNICDILKNYYEMEKFLDENKNIVKRDKKILKKCLSICIYHAISIYVRMRQEDKNEAYFKIKKDVLKNSIRHSYNLRHKIKIIIFTYFRSLLDYIYNKKRSKK